MNTLFVASFFVVLLTVVCSRPDTYLDDFDNINIDAVLSNKRLVNNYLHCIKTGQKCTPDGVKARELIPNALKTRCEKCNESQRMKILQILEWVIQNKPKDFLEIEKIFDSDHSFRNEFESELKGRNIILPSLT
ncbi:hypothetical protein FQR65_LT09310 [Abscondita terminalis]|nr:hypothetical protein FQR65_LT09310 [Abscondita terminalis]